MKKKNFINPILLKTVSSMFLRAKMIVDGPINGIHESSFKGISTDFTSHRKYSFGDELRFVDWKIYAKTNKYFVKQFVEESSLRTYFLLDISKSMGFKSSDCLSKIDYASYLIATLAYLMLKQHDLVGLTTFDSKVKSNLMPGSGEKRFHTLTDILESIKLGADTDIYKALIEFGRNLKKRGLIIIMSDLLDDYNKLWRVIKYFKYCKHDVILFHILDKNEKELQIDGEYITKDLETSKVSKINYDTIKDSYNKIMKEIMEFYRYNSSKLGIEYFPVTTDMPLEYAIMYCLRNRNK